MSDMKLIMENWRGYVNVLDSSLQQAELECDDAKSDTIYLIKESKIKETSFSLLMEKYDRDEISTEKLGKILEESVEYEHQKLLNEGVLDVLKKSWAEWKKDAPPEELGKIAKAQWRARQALYVFTYGAAAKAIRFVRGVIKKLVGAVGGYLKKVFPLTKNPPKQSVAVKLLKQALKLAGYVGKVLKGAAKALGAIVKPVIKLLSNPVVKNALMVACVAVLIVSMVMPTALVAAPAFLVPMATRRVAVATAKKAIGLKEQEESLDEDVGDLGAAGIGWTFTMGEFAEQIYDQMSLDEIGKAMDILATQIGDATVDQRVIQSTIENVVISPDGTEVVDYSNKVWIGNSNELVAEQMRALQELKQLALHRKYDKAIDVIPRGLDSSMDAMDNIVRNTLAAAKFHCEDDPAACKGASKFVAEINVLSNQSVKSEIAVFSQQTREFAKVSGEIVKDEISYTGTSARSGDTATRTYVSRAGSVDPGQPELIEPGQVGPKGREVSFTDKIRTRAKS